MSAIGPGQRHRKHRMLRSGDVPGDLVVVIRATLATRAEAVADIAKDARVSADTYVVGQGDEVELLYGVSVFARRPGPRDVLERFVEAPTYLEVTVGVVRAAGFSVLPTGANPDHFDVQLVSGRPESQPAPEHDVAAAAARLVRAAGDLLPNPFYAGS